MTPDAANAAAGGRGSWAPARGGAGEPDELARLSARIAELERERARLDRFAAMAAHELAEPLLLTEEYAGLLLERLGAEADTATRSDLEALSRVTARLRLVVETLLHEARSAGRPAGRERVELSQVVDDALALLEHEIRAHDAHVAVTSLPTVLGDAALLGIVMKNLLSNAIRHGPSGGAVRVAASHSKRGWRISVISEGAPISRTERRRIFQPFERGSASGELGLGLAICQTIVQRHGGALSIRASARGNQFAVTLPA